MLSTARLNRALLARQLLLRRRRITVLDAVEHLVGIQSQAPRAAYIGLWTRVAGFRPEALERLMLDRSVVRVALMRSTILLASARECLALRGLVRPAIVRMSRHSAARRAAGVADADLERAGRALVDAEPRSMRELGSLLRERWPAWTPTPSRWGCESWCRSSRFRRAACGIEAACPPSPTRRRGSRASLTNGQLSMAGLAPRGLRPGDATLDGPGVHLLPGFATSSSSPPGARNFRDASGGELFDLPEAPRPAARTRPPARFLPEFATSCSRTRAASGSSRGTDVAARARKRPAPRVPDRRLPAGHVAAPGDRPRHNARGDALRAAFGLRVLRNPRTRGGACWHSPLAALRRRSRSQSPRRDDRIPRRRLFG